MHYAIMGEVEDGRIIIMREDHQGIPRYGLTPRLEKAYAKDMGKHIGYWYGTLDDLLATENTKIKTV